MRRAILAVLVTAVGLVLLLSFKPHEMAASANRPSYVSQSGGQSGRVTAHSGSWTGAGAGAGAVSGDKVLTGDAVDTRWGPVQVELVLSSGKVTGVKVLQAPDNNHRDISINNRALPILNQETLSAQSAQIDTVSGATYTSEGYIRSLQSALDRNGL
ncbi:FMN-binding protein [Streptosporangium sp. NPDC087985]|uniref:FMN-binding protein n=1 Tax=Streptosporangium sp. NPDC087985 TaxID=3366196 RepID=UPI00381BB813